MVKKRNRRTRKKYKKRGGEDKVKACNDRLKEKFPNKGLIWRRTKCAEDSSFGTESPSKPSAQPIAQQKEPTELKQPSGVESVIAPLEEEPEQPTQPVQGPGVQSVIAPLEEEPKKPKIQKSQKMKDRVSALEKKFGETDRQKGRKALRTTVGSCRAAVDKNGNKYYYNEAKETTRDPTDEVCHPKDGIEKTGNISGDCIGARYKGGEEYWYHPTKQFSTHNKNHPLCHSVEGIYKTGVDSDVPLTPGFKVNKSVTQKPQPQESKKIEEENKSNVECSELSNTKCKKSDNCELVTKKIKGNLNNKKNKVKKCLPKKKGGKRTKRKKSRKKRKKSRKRRR